MGKTFARKDVKKIQYINLMNVTFVTNLSRVNSVARKHVKTVHQLTVHTCYVCNMASKGKAIATDRMISHIGRGVFELSVSTAAARRFPTAAFTFSLK
jgi:hypothetical protein